MLRPELELFAAPDGNLYLLGLQQDHVLEQPTPAVRGLLDVLRQCPLTAADMIGRLAEDGDHQAATDAIKTLVQSGLLIEHRQDPALLDARDRERFDRQLAYFAQLQPGQEHRMQTRLGQARIAIIGVGGLGSWAAACLACAGVTQFILIDPDTVDLSNLNRQILYTPVDIGKPKVQQAAQALTRFNPAAQITTRQTSIGSKDDLIDLAAEATFVVATADQPPHAISRWINEACLKLGIPYLSAGQVPPYIRIGPLVVPGLTACFECTEIAARRRYPYYDALVEQRQATRLATPTLGAASAMVGSIIAMEVTHHLTGAAQPGTLGRAVEIDLRTWKTVYIGT